MPIFKDLTARGLLALLLGAVILIGVIAAILMATMTRRAQQEAVDAKGGQVVAEGASRVGDKIAGATADLADRQAGRDQLTRETQDEILNHPAAGRAVDPDLHRTTIERLCLRQANTAKPACVQLRQQGSAAASR